MFVIAPFLLSNSHLAAHTVTGNDDLGVRPGRIRTMRPPQAESLSQPLKSAQKARRLQERPQVRTRSPGEPSRNTPPTARGRSATTKARVVRPMRSPGALRAISVISCAMKLPAMDRPANCSTRQATKRTAELSPSAGRDRLPAPGSGKAESVVDLRPEREVRRDPLRECKSVGRGRSRGCAWQAGRARALDPVQ